MALGNDDLAEAFRPLIANLHENIEAIDDGPLKTRLRRRAFIAHAAMEDLHSDAASGGLVQPLAGSDKPPPVP